MHSLCVDLNTSVDDFRLTKSNNMPNMEMKNILKKTQNVIFEVGKTAFAHLMMRQIIISTIQERF